VAFPHLGPIAEEEGLVTLLPAGVLADVARACIEATVTTEEALARLQAGADPASVHCVRDWVGPARPRLEDAERELRRAVVKAAVERIDRQYGEALKRVAKAGSAAVDDLSVTAQRLLNQKRDLTTRLRSLERRG
jgi:DNA primase